MASGVSLTVGLLWHSARAPNLGVGALTVANIAIIEKIAAELGLAPKFLIMGWPDAEARYVAGDAIELYEFRYRELLKPRGALYRQFKKCDVIFDISAGDSFADIYGARRSLAFILSKFLAAGSGAPLVLSPQTIGPFNRPLTRTMAQMALRRARAVVTRDAKSTAFVGELGYAGELVEATDVAFRLPFDPPKRSAGGPVRVGVNASGLLMNGGYTKKNMFDLAFDYPALIKKMVDWLQNEAGAEVHLVAHVVPDKHPVEDDYAAAQALAKEFPDATLAPRFRSPSEAKSYIAGLDFFVGSRMHACIAAFSARVPVAPLAYSRKFAGLFGTLGFDRTIDCRETPDHDALAQIKRAYAERGQILDEIDAALGQAELRLERYEALLRRILREVAQ